MKPLILLAAMFAAILPATVESGIKGTTGPVRVSTPLSVEIPQAGIAKDDVDIVNAKNGQTAICGVLVRDGDQNGKARYRGVGTRVVSAVMPGGTWVSVSVVPGNYYLIPHNGGWNCHVPPR